MRGIVAPYWDLSPFFVGVEEQTVRLAKAVGAEATDRTSNQPSLEAALSALLNRSGSLKYSLAVSTTRLSNARSSGSRSVTLSLARISFSENKL